MSSTGLLIAADLGWWRWPFLALVIAGSVWWFIDQERRRGR